MTAEFTEPDTLPSYFTGVDKLTDQITQLHLDFFFYPDGSYSNEFVMQNGLMARNTATDNLEGSETHIGYGVLAGLCTLELTNDNFKLGIGTHMRNAYSLSDNDAEKSREFLFEHFYKAKYFDEIDERFVSEFNPITNALANIYDFDGDCEQTVRARESVLIGFKYGLNSIISMCDDWDEWTVNLGDRIKSERLNKKHNSK